MKPWLRRIGALMPALAPLALGAATLAAFPEAASARRMSVDVWTDRGDDGVYRPGDRIEVSARISQGAHLLVYEIDAEGYVHVLFPYGRSDSYLEGPATLRLPDDETDLQLVAEAPVGEGFIVAIASVEPFERVPWYLRPYDANVEELGYRDDGGSRDNEGVTDDGRIVGDPFVAMERIRRQVLYDPEDRGGFATAYATYYVHERVKYPRYLCNDCHRPGVWRWWDGFDPYYTSCSTFDLRVNVGWWWGPSVWFGNVPYYLYSYRADCPPHYRHFGNVHYSSWQGWGTWRDLWGPMRRIKSPPPSGYLPPTKYDGTRRWKETGRDLPPGFLPTTHQLRERRGPSLGRGAKDFEPGGGEGRQRRGDVGNGSPRERRQGGAEVNPRERQDGSGVKPRERRQGGAEVNPRERQDGSDVKPRERRGGSTELKPREPRDGGSKAAPRDRRDSGSPERRRDDASPRREPPPPPRGEPGSGRGDRRRVSLLPAPDRRDPAGPRFAPRVERPTGRPAGQAFRAGSGPRFEPPARPAPQEAPARFDRPAPTGYHRTSESRFERPQQAAPPPRNGNVPSAEAPRERWDAAPKPAAAPPPSAPKERTGWGGGPRTKG